MLVWNMMDERKLNIDAPLMSVRRSFGTPPSLTETTRRMLEKPQTLPLCESDTTLDQVTDPVAVPFNWEHIPGRSKDYDGSELQPPEQASIVPTPTLPPGKSINHAKRSLKKDTNVANNFRSPNTSNSFSEKIQWDREGKNVKTEKVEDNDDYDNDDDVFSDALETLSPTEPLSMNCSVSGVSGLDNLDSNMCGASSTDKQAHDFMMSRFLHAAKAVTIQPPQYISSRKQSVLAEQPREFIKLVPEQKKSFVNRYITDIVPYNGQCQEDEEEESGDETNDYANISSKGCGLLPRLCVRNSLCMLNPVTGTKMGNQLSLYSAYEVGKPDKSSHIRSHRPAPVIKKAWDAINMRKSSSRAASPNKQDLRKKWTSESSRYTYSGEMKQLDKLSPFRRSRAASATDISPFPSKSQPLLPGVKSFSDSKQANSNLSDKLKYPSRGSASIQDMLSQGAKRSSSSGSFTVEKTLYIDTASTLKSSCSSSRSLGSATVAGKERNSLLDSFRDTKHLHALDENLGSQELNSVDVNSSTLPRMVYLMAKEDKAERMTADQEINQESTSLQLVPGSFDKDAEINNQQIVAIDDQGNVGTEYVLHPLAPPLPKSPSESWLCRALPLVSSKNSFPHKNQGTQSKSKRQGFSRASSYTKWETIVKSSNVNHDQVTCSKELVVYRSHHSKS
ncbi:hypothetical protein LR48_Vigan01g046100 [Vigna angularis]|uniref:Uncharacterized protein n=2 Tax=Phaseolus angularis TaxID=3914 RepID=A0A0L9TK91_PHAAN|nr:uncharacterized protein LOC108322162 [Vigna angularis]KAG2410268.1 uncharacterized protein HKW66_Vig0009330 [Vigna angularis]KOM30906.1 hypothetical protein LR48_Vigan01g046100 [Vigna angularis]BAT73613.1 hypothetical protein VIGAN_01111600 [Vigna angularis var. angularis]